jgi:mevalonate kinase
MNTVTVSAPGKVHLMGEHAVVYGKPALLAAVNKRLTVSITSAEQTTINISVPEAVEFIRFAIAIVDKEYQLSPLPYNLSVSSEIPFGYHLGSSAALAVATVGVYIYFRKKLWNPTEINRLAYEVEKKQHGNPSGGDNTSVTFGGFLWYRKELEFLKSLWQLPLKLPKELQHLYLVNTGKPEETTGEMVELVKSKVKSQKSKLEEMFNINEECTRSVAVAIKNNDQQLFVSSIQRGEQTLEAMGVVSEYVVPFIRQIEEIGGAAKILGGGGKKKAVGFLLVYHPQQAQIETIVKKYDWTVETVVLGEEGIRLESGKQ